MICIFTILWFFRQIKAILFWLYFWQLKEYHILRFLDHFRTENGKKLLLNKLLILKIILIFILFFSQNYLNFFVFSLMVLTILYLLESIKFLKDILSKNFKKPVLTKKTSLLLFFSFFIVFFYLLSLFLNGNIFGWLLLFDVLTPLIISGIVLLFQPITFLLRNRIIEKAKRKRQKFKDLLAIGITGSYGKTSTKELLKVILSDKFKVLTTKEHQNSEVGVSNCILNDLNKEHEIFIVEMGAYNRGGIKLLCSIAKPKFGILTGINEQHLATFGSLENIIKTKFELIESLPEDGMAIFNGDNQIIKNLETKIRDYNSKLKNIKFCSTREKRDIFAENIKIEKDCISFNVFSKDGDKVFFKINVSGIQNIENIILAICCAKELGMSLNEISDRFSEIKTEGLGMKFLKGINSINIIDSTYSANPDGVIFHLEHLKLWKGKKIVIMPCLIELAQASKGVHQKIGKKIAEVCDFCIITNKECFSEIEKSAVGAGMSKEKILFSESPEEIVKIVKDFSDSEDIILLEGRVSKSIIKSLIKNGI
jgi:UDP-N-acetylmuramoyl-tripeptide--D-alanyl-D-alanine ligase